MILADFCFEWVELSTIMLNFAVVNPNEGQQDVPDNGKKELRGFRTLPTTKRRD